MKKPTSFTAKVLKLADIFGDPLPKGTQAKVNSLTPGWSVSRASRKQTNQRRAQGARARCKR